MLFCLPAFVDPDMQAWMSGTFPSTLAVANASVGDLVDLQCLQNTILRQALKDQHSLLANTAGKLSEFCHIFTQ